MRLPLSQNRLVALAAVAVVLTGGLTAVLATPGVFGGNDAGPSADAPQASGDGVTVVQPSSGSGDDHDDHEADEHEEDDEGYEDEYESVATPPRVVAP